MRITPELMLTHVANTLWKLHRTNQPQGVDLALRLLARRCGPLSEATTTRIQTLQLEQLEALAEALLDFSGPDDLTTWLAAHG